MEQIVCAVRDSALDAFSRPFFVPTRAFGIRSFVEEVKNPQSPMHVHQKDYELFQLGTFDEQTGKFQNLAAPQSLLRALDVHIEEKGNAG